MISTFRPYQPGAFITALTAGREFLCTEFFLKPAILI